MRKLLLTLTFVFIIGLIDAQVFTLRKDSVSLNEFMMQLEVESNYEFFYEASWMDTYLYEVDFQNKPVIDAIKWLCNKYSLTYSLVDENKVIFFKDYNLKSNYAEVYSNYVLRKEVFAVESTLYEPPRKIEKKSNHINPEYLLYTIGSQSQGGALRSVTLSGKIKDMETGEPLIGAVVYVDDLKDGTITNPYGFYSYTLPKGRYKLEFRSVGMKTTYRNVVVHSDGELDVEMKSTPQALGEVIITAKSEDPVSNLRMGMEKITMKTLKQLPLGMGEADVIKSTLLLPGVQSVGEASGGFNVRGGSTDQNLILLSDAPILNTSHFFGFFSGFNSDIIKDITLYKSGIPAKYGGRVSSVMDITLKDGNRKNVKVNGGISPVSGRLIVEGPIKKEKSSFVIGARTTYSDWVLRLLDDPKLENSKASFHDLQGNF
ncbi:MAG: TonB-dependent receptor, partial [Marinilabiliaceae bacterium]|nr:TonB-dependent receptor [Marinilabiliaceae bacterium]